MGGCSIVDKAIFHENYLLLPEELNSALHTLKPYALKLFHGRSAEVYYAAELRAFQYLSRYSEWPTAIIRCIGSIHNNDTFGLFLEHADRGNLELYMQQNPPPTTERDMLRLWSRLLQLSNAISALHRIPQEDNGEAKLG